MIEEWSKNNQRVFEESQMIAKIHWKNGQQILHTFILEQERVLNERFETTRIFKHIRKHYM